MNKSYILGSHNSWSYLKPKQWWLRPFAFIAKCQSVDIKTQYIKYGVRCFDLRVRFNKYGLGVVAHGLMQYCYTASKIYEDLAWLDGKCDCHVRVIHEVRRKSQYTDLGKEDFSNFCRWIERNYPNIRFWCGRNIYNWQKDYDFGKDPTCEEKYSSVCKPNWIDDWWPWLFAKLNNREIIQEETDKEILLIDFVNIR